MDATSKSQKDRRISKSGFVFTLNFELSYDLETPGFAQLLTIAVLARRVPRLFLTNSFCLETTYNVCLLFLLLMSFI